MSLQIIPMSICAYRFYFCPQKPYNMHEYVQMQTFYWNLEATDDYSCQKLNVILTCPVWIDFIWSLNTDGEAVNALFHSTQIPALW